MGGLLQYKWEVRCGGFPFFKAQKLGKHSNTHGGCIAVQIGGVLPYFLDELYGLDVPKRCPANFGSTKLLEGYTKAIFLRNDSRDTFSRKKKLCVGVCVSGLLMCNISRAKNQPKEAVFGTDIPRTSGGHSRGYPDPKLRSGWPKSWKNKHLGADIHDPKAQTSTTLRDLQKLWSEKLWAEFPFLIYKDDIPVCSKGTPSSTLRKRLKGHWPRSSLFMRLLLARDT